MISLNIISSPMNIVQNIAAIIVGLAFYYNVGKFFIMAHCYIEDKAYGIFPWSDVPVISRSKPIWLIFHLASSLTIVIFSFRMILYRKKSTLFKLAHWIFTILILLNITNFGQSNNTTAIIINGIPLLVANVAYWFIERWKYMPVVYFLTINSGVLLEVCLYLQPTVSMLIYIFNH